MPIDLPGLKAILTSWFSQPQAYSRITRTPIYTYSAPGAQFGGFQHRGKIFLNTADPNIGTVVNHESAHQLIDPYLDKLNYDVPGLDRVRQALAAGGYGAGFTNQPKNVLSEGIAYGTSGQIPGLDQGQSNDFISNVVRQVHDQVFRDTYNRLIKGGYHDKSSNASSGR